MAGYGLWVGLNKTSGESVSLAHRNLGIVVLAVLVWLVASGPFGPMRPKKDEEV